MIHALLVAVCLGQFDCSPAITQPPVAQHLFGDIRVSSVLYADIKYSDGNVRSVLVVNGYAPAITYYPDHTVYDYRRKLPYKLPPQPQQPQPQPQQPQPQPQQPQPQPQQPQPQPQQQQKAQPTPAQRPGQSQAQPEPAKVLADKAVKEAKALPRPPRFDVELPPANATSLQSELDKAISPTSPSEVQDAPTGITPRYRNER